MMNIEIEKWVINDREWEVNVAHKIVAVTKCCDDILDEDYLILTSKDNYGTNMGYGFKLIRTEQEYDGNVEYYYKDIKCCPFCGKPINVIVDDTIDYTDSYKRLTEKQEELYKKRNKSDSIKNRNKFDIEIKEVDKRVSYIWNDDGIKALSDLLKGGSEINGI